MSRRGSSSGRPRASGSMSCAPTARRPSAGATSGTRSSNTRGRFQLVIASIPVPPSSHSRPVPLHHRGARSRPGTTPAPRPLALAALPPPAPRRRAARQVISRRRPRRMAAISRGHPLHPGRQVSHLPSQPGIPGHQQPHHPSLHRDHPRGQHPAASRAQATMIRTITLQSSRHAGPALATTLSQHSIGRDDKS